MKKVSHLYHLPINKLPLSDFFLYFCLQSFYNKKNMRSLSSIEYNEAENIKTKIFLSLDPLSRITEDVVLSKLNTVDSIDNNLMLTNYSKLYKTLSHELNRQLTTDELKYTRAYFYQLVYSSEETNT